ncbi:hypothetical protein LOK49_LG09G02502 [Camellia lanceoleosa]|uniref:Uncharacterized protein n=1 Tax=Camellia lanceoleosa TaxID=1840588 RepID=A0ACC0GNZ6_9ERIC|nr:hypothetical protein LOK49_LG09G02502 [Camellia lanceoleosa]
MISRPRASRIASEQYTVVESVKGPMRVTDPKEDSLENESPPLHRLRGKPFGKPRSLRPILATQQLEFGGFMQHNRLSVSWDDLGEVLVYKAVEMSLIEVLDDL